jgi:hypothetical protein
MMYSVGYCDVVCAIGNVEIDVALLIRAAVAFHVETPHVEAALREPVHCGRVRRPGHVQIEGRLRSHRRAVLEQDCRTR